jgi:hypothetical protein
MRVPFAENLRTSRDERRRFRGVHRTGVRAIAAPPAYHGASNLPVEQVDEPEILVIGRVRTVRSELLTNMFVHRILRALRRGGDPVVRRLICMRTKGAEVQQRGADEPNASVHD